MQIRRDTQYSLRIGAQERADLDALAASAGVPLSVALRVGARAWLTRINQTCDEPGGHPARASDPAMESPSRGRA